MLRWCRTRWQPLRGLLLGRCTNLLKDSTEIIAQHSTVWGRHASWGIFWADINSFCVQLMKSVSKGFCVLMFKVLKRKKGRISILSMPFALLFLHCEVKMKGYIYTGDNSRRIFQEEIFKNINPEIFACKSILELEIQKFYGSYRPIEVLPCHKYCNFFAMVCIIQGKSFHWSLLNVLKHQSLWKYIYNFEIGGWIFGLE